MSHTSGPSELVAIVRAAHLVGDQDLKRVAVRELKDRFGITLRFAPAVKAALAKRAAQEVAAP